MMKRILLSVVLMSVAAVASAQSYYVDAANPEILRFGDYREAQRKEIVIPSQVNGYNVCKADLHTHSVYSDGSVSPQFRVKEAWLEGLDVIAVTEHIEYRPFENEFGEYLHADLKKDRDLNAAVKLAQREGAYWDVFIIPGTEITRDGTTVGHFNALFTQDNNKVYDDDPVQAIRNAKAQGALVMHNHPGWWRTSIDFTEAEKIAYGEGLIDGIETMNGPEFYPKAIERAQELGLFVTANTDVHSTTGIDFPVEHGGRNMTLVFAKEKSLEAVREALEECRTISYSYKNLAGDEQLLKDLFNACITFEPVRLDYKQRQIFNITNHSSIPFALRVNGSNVFWVDPFTTVQTKARNPKLTVVNMWYGVEKHPVVEVTF